MCGSSFSMLVDNSRIKQQTVAGQQVVCYIAKNFFKLACCGNGVAEKWFVTHFFTKVNHPPKHFLEHTSVKFQSRVLL